MPLGAFRLNSLGKVAAAAAGRTALTVTTHGNAKVSTAQSKFGGASLLLDGTGDYIKADDATLAVGTGDFTFECWARVADTAAFMLFDQTTPTGSSNGISIWCSFGKFNVYSGGWIAQAVGTVNNNTWYHFAVTLDSSNNLRCFIDGTQVGTTQTFTNNINQTPLYMGAARIDTTSYDGNGYMDEIRVSNIARYTANFTAPTAAFTNDANTLLLIHCDGTNASTVFRDDVGTSRSQLGISAHGTAALSTTQSKFGGTSLDFGDGVSDYYKVYAPTTSYFGGTGNMTFEFWYYRKSSGSGLHITDFRSGGGDTAWTIVDFEDGRLGVYHNGYIVATNFGVTTLTWTHVAAVRQGTSLKWYKNGTLTDTNTVTSGAWSNRTDCFIGANFADQTAGNNINAYIDELRISNIARYTANFTAPTAPFQNDSNTLLLIHADGTNGSTVIIDDNG